MGVSHPDRARRLSRLGFLAPAVLLFAHPGGSSAQVEASPVLGGSVFVADTALVEGVVVLHHVSDGEQGELDSVQVGAAGSFSFSLPRAPDPERSDIFFASVRHDGVLYFGPAITRVMDLDSVYEIHAYDTLLAPVGGVSVTMEGRSLFLEADSGGIWRATDLFQLRNDRDRTVVARPDGHTWSYPLPAEARNVTAGEGEMSIDAATFEDGAIVVRAALPPGERLFVARYTLDSPFISIPTPGLTETIDLLVREPVPPLEVEGLAAVDRIELEAGSTFRRYTGEGYAEESVRLVELDSIEPPRAEWIAVIMAMMLTVAGLLAMRGGWATPAEAPAPASGRAELLLEVARLDEEFEATGDPSQSQRRKYEQRRGQLMDRIRSEA